MNQGIVIYKSKYGTTKKYAEWIAQDVKYDLIEVSNANLKDIAKYNNIVFCGAIYASGINGLSFLKKNHKILSNKNIAILCIGASPYEERSFTNIKTHNLKNELSNIPIFYGRGAWNEKTMKIIDRTLCKMLQKAITKKAPTEYEPWETALMESIGKSCDWTDKSYLIPLLELVKQWQIK